MSILSYNSVILPYAETTSFLKIPVGDDVSNTDWHLTRYEISVNCVINSNYLEQLGVLIVNGNPSTDNSAAIMLAVRNKLMQRRRSLSFKFNGFELIPREQTGLPATAFVDADNGPIPQSCQIFQLTDVTFFIAYTIHASYWENNNVVAVAGGLPTVSNDRGNNVLYNRWTETADINNLQYTTRIREGKYKIRSDNFEGKVPDEIRNDFANVSIPSGFLRESSSYTITADGLAIQYRVVDKEQFKLPPEPAFKADGEYIETGTNQAATRVGRCRVRLEGSKIVPQAKLVQKAVSLAASKVLQAGAVLNNTPQGLDFTGAIGIQSTSKGFANLKSVVVAVGMWENWVECSIEVLLRQKQQRLAGTTLVNPLLVNVPFVDNGIARDSHREYKLRGTASILLQAAAYYDPSIVKNMMDGEQMNVGREPGRAARFPE